MTAPPAIRRAHYFGIFVISFALLAYQIVLTRIFSVVLYYHFAIAGVTLAMLGLTLGAQRVFSNPTRFRAERRDHEWGKAAVGFAVSSVSLAIAFLHLPQLFPAQEGAAAAVKLFTVLFVIPFTYGSICITLLLTGGGRATAKLYATDLVGAALGCAGSVAALFYMGPIALLFLLACAVFIAAFSMLMPNLRQNRLLLTSGLCALAAVALLQFILFSPNVVTYAYSDNTIHFERWNAFSRIKSVHDEFHRPFGWGFGKPQNYATDTYNLLIDAGSNAALTRFNGDKSTIAYLANDVLNIGYLIRPIQYPLVIGVGGGRDLLSAIYFGVTKVTGLELNPAIMEALTGPFAAYSGNIAKRGDVELVTAEARSWLAQSNRKFDLVQISMINTWAATAAGGLSLAENKLFTTEAWKEFLSHLTPQGMLVVCRWHNPAKNHVHEFYRLLSLAVQTLKETGIPSAAAKDHILAYQGGNLVTVVVSPSPFTPEEMARLQTVAVEKNFTLLASKDYTVDAISHAIMQGEPAQGTRLDLSAPTDNRPFFFYTSSLSYLFSNGLLLGNENDRYHRQDVQVILLLLCATFLFMLYCGCKPVLSKANGASLTQWRHIGYFTLIGLGFMLIEISQMQRLMIVLGHPVYGLSVVLFSLLLFSGIGSFTVGPGMNMLQRSIVLNALLIITGLLTPALTGIITHHSITFRILSSVALIAPMGLFMGMMLPIGMLTSQHLRPLQPWFWGINGAASVFASVLGMAISLELGISATYWSGVACYMLCIPLIITLTGKPHVHPTS